MRRGMAAPACMCADYTDSEPTAFYHSAQVITLLELEGRALNGRSRSHVRELY